MQNRFLMPFFLGFAVSSTACLTDPMRPAPATITYVAQVDASLADTAPLMTDDGWSFRWNDWFLAMRGASAYDPNHNSSERAQCEQYSKDYSGRRIVSLLGARETTLSQIYAFGQCLLRPPSVEPFPPRWLSFEEQTSNSNSYFYTYALGPRVDEKRLATLLAFSIPSGSPSRSINVLLSGEAQKENQTFRLTLGLPLLGECFGEKPVTPGNPQYESVLLRSNDSPRFVVEISGSDLFRANATAPTKFQPFVDADFDKNGELNNQDLGCIGNGTLAATGNTNNRGPFCTDLLKKIRLVLHCE